MKWGIPLPNENEDLIEEIKSINENIQRLFLMIQAIAPGQKKMLTRQEVAHICGIKSLTTLWNWERKGYLKPSKQAGRKPLYKLQDVEEFLSSKNLLGYDR